MARCGSVMVVVALGGGAGVAERAQTWGPLLKLHVNFMLIIIISYFFQIMIH